MIIKTPYIIFAFFEVSKENTYFSFFYSHIVAYVLFSNVMCFKDLQNMGAFYINVRYVLSKKNPQIFYLALHAYTFSYG